MVSEIVLPAGTTNVTVRAIPRLLAHAIHPAPPEGAGNVISYLLKQAVDLDAIPAPRGEPLSEDDWALLGNIWHELPPFETGMSDATWWQYLDAFESSRYKPDWALLPCLSGGTHEAKMLQFITEGDHKTALHSAINKGELVALNRSMLKIPASATGRQVDEAIVMIDALKAYAVQFGVNVRCDEPPPVAEPQALPVVAAGTSGVTHSTKVRRDTLTPVIELAQKQCVNSKDTAEVWAALLVLAEKRSAPLIGATEDGLQYLKNGAAANFTRNSLGKRLAR